MEVRVAVSISPAACPVVQLVTPVTGACTTLSLLVCCSAREQGWVLIVIIGRHGNQTFVDRCRDIVIPLIEY